MTAMNNEQFPEDLSRPARGNQDSPEKSPPQPKISLLGRWLETLAHLGVGETMLRIGTNVFAVCLILTVVWLMRNYYHQPAPGGTSDVLAASQPTATPTLATADVPSPVTGSIDSISRLASLHTIIPSRPRVDVITYAVQTGDSVFGIADKFGLKPSTILFGNYATLKDTPHSLRPGQELNILPVDGTYYEWQAGDGLNAVAQFFGVDAEAIVNFPGNHLDPDTIGDYTHPNIQAGTWLIVPGGKREFTSWQAPIGVTRDQPALARVMGAGSCGAISGGAVGFGTFVWPTTQHRVGGYNYSPETGHLAIDLAGSLDSGIFATDSGVIVYAGWNDYGYGNLIMIDHGNGWQSLYAHLDQINVGCGQSVGQGELIGLMGSTGNSSGPHLHFELMHTQYGKVNPLDFLPPP
jgi:murein DD-endopeptidase MepM/ murein hydrolase activator NlpD